MNHQLTRKTPGRNDPCPCGSGKKYKKCCIGKAGENFASENTNFPLENLVKQAEQAFTAGEIELANTLCSEILRHSPANSSANHIMALVKFSLGNLEDSLKHFEKAIAKSSRNPQIRSNYAKLLLSLGLVPEAEHQLRSAIKSDSQYIDAFITYGNILMSQERYESANSYFTKATAIDPYNAEAISGKLFSAYKLGNFEEAVTGYEGLIDSGSRYIAGYINLATILRDQGYPEKAAKTLQQALLIDPDNSELHNLVGSLLAQVNDESGGLRHIKKAIEINPEYQPAYINLIELLTRMNDIEQALVYATKIAGRDGWIELKTYAARVFGRAALFKQRQDVCESIISYVKSNPGAYKDIYQLLLLSNYLEHIDRETIYHLHEGWCKEFVGDRNSYSFSTRNKKDPNITRLKIGYLSKEFRNHPVATFVKNVLSHHDQNLFDVFCYYDYETSDEVTSEIENSVSALAHVYGKSAREISDQIYKDEIDILIDLGGHTSHTNIEVLAHKPAPIQISYL